VIQPDRPGRAFASQIISNLALWTRPAPAVVSSKPDDQGPARWQSEGPSRNQTQSLIASHCIQMANVGWPGAGRAACQRAIRPQGHQARSQVEALSRTFAVLAKRAWIAVGYQLSARGHPALVSGPSARRALWRRSRATDWFEPFRPVVRSTPSARVGPSRAKVRPGRRECLRLPKVNRWFLPFRGIPGSISIAAMLCSCSYSLSHEITPSIATTGVPSALGPRVSIAP
jgi:hypothetical protein